jgi:tungstate transport system ATP-binding protein
MSARLTALLGVSKRFGGRVILAGADIGFEAGRAYVLTGDNGSGKSTLLRILAGLEPAAGTLLFGEQRFLLPDYPDYLRRQIIYVHQHPYLFHTSLLHNIAYGLRARGEAAASWRPKALEALAWARLQDTAETPPQRLSGGERQRVALARAKVLAPRLLLLDEPTANLDAESRAQVVDLIATLCAAGDSTVVIACHDRELLDLPGVERLHLENGKVVAA